MKEHEDDVMLSVAKTTVTIDEVVVSEAKTEGFSVEKDQREDMMVDVVGDDVDGQTAEEVAVSGGVRVFRVEKVEVVENEEGLKEDFIQEHVVARGSNGVMDSTESTEGGLTKGAVEETVEKEAEIVDASRIGGSSIATANLGFDEVDRVVVEEGYVGKDETTEVVNEGKSEVDGRNKEESLCTTIEVITTDDQEMTNVGCVVNEKSGNENESLDSLEISEPLNSVDHGSEDVNVVAVGNGLADKDEGYADPNMVCPDNGSSPTHVDNSTTGESIAKDAQNVENGAGVEDSKSAVEALIGEPQSIEEKEKTERKKEEIVERPIESVQDVKGFMDDKTGNRDVVLDSSKITESLNKVNAGSAGANGEAPIEDVVKHPEFSYVDADMEIGDDVGVDIDEVLGWKDEMAEFDVTNGGPGKDQDFKFDGNFEDAEHGISGGHREDNAKSREPIVYGRRVNVEVPLYDVLDEITPPLLEDENLEIETDSDEYNEYVHEEEQVPEPSGSLFSLHQSCYFTPPEKEGEFSVSDLVWGKVRSHPWWPGQIMDPSIASQKAMKYHKKDCYLVAYFGDHSFAWNDSTTLQPFRANFSQMEKQTNLETFKIAVEGALEEVSRRVELGLACSCVPRTIYKKIEYQVIENAGVSKKSSTRHGLDKSASTTSFEPDKLVEYVRLLAQFPDEGDKLELAMAKAQLSSYGRYKGHRELPEFQSDGDLLGDASIEQVNTNGEQLEKKLIERASGPNKEISLSEVTDDAPESGYGDNITSRSVSSSGYKKRKARDSISNGSVKRRNRHPDKSPATPLSTPKPSFKIGEMIRRVASQLTGPPSKVDNGQQDGQDADQLVGSAISLNNTEHFQEASVAEMLSHLHLTAQNPMKDYSFLNTIIPFFYDRRAAVFSKSLKKNSTIDIEKPVTTRKRKASNENDPVDFEFDLDDINDSYWTDRIIQNQPEDPLLQDHQNGGLEYQIVAYEQDTPARRSRRSNKKRVSNSKREKVEVKEESEVEKRRRENLATEVVLMFAEGIYFPSEVNLIKMFRRFGPLMESETEVDRQGGRARVVFKRCSDAEVAHSSAGKFNIFGSIDVSYKLNYTPLVSYKPLPLGPVSVLQDPMDAS